MKNKTKLFLALGVITASILPSFSNQLNISADVGEVGKSQSITELFPIESISLYADNEIYSVSLYSATWLPSLSDAGVLIQHYSTERVYSDYTLDVSFNRTAYNSTIWEGKGYSVTFKYDISFTYNNTSNTAWGNVDYIRIKFFPAWSNYYNDFNIKYNQSKDFATTFYTYDSQDATKINYLKYYYYESYIEGFGLTSTLYESPITRVDDGGYDNLGNNNPISQRMDFNSSASFGYYFNNSFIDYWLGSDIYSSSSLTTYSLGCQSQFLLDKYVSPFTNFVTSAASNIRGDLDVDFSGFLTESVGGFLDFELFGISLSEILYVVVGICLLIIILKMFLGG